MSGTVAKSRNGRPLCQGRVFKPLASARFKYKMLRGRKRAATAWAPMLEGNLKAKGEEGIVRCSVLICRHLTVATSETSRKAESNAQLMAIQLDGGVFC